MAKRMMAVCDRCESIDGVTRWVVDGPDGRVVLDLCREHAAPIRELTTDGDGVQLARRGRRTYVISRDA